MTTNPTDGRSRRAFLAGVSGAVSVALAGCTGDSSGGSETTSPDPEPSLGPPVAGDPDAAVTVTVFEDFACPHCRNFNRNVLPSLRSEYVDPGEVRYEHRDFPIPVHETVSWQAPNAARAVQDGEGDEAFFEYADLLFEEQGSLDADAYASLAGDVGAAPEAIREAATGRSYDPTIRADRALGDEMGVGGTPAVFVNDEQVDSGLDAVAAAIDDARSGVE